MRVYAGFVILIAYLGWILYHLAIKKDLKQHLQAFYANSFFVGIWVLIYVCILIAAPK
jgi:hypothetical protein